MTNDIGEGWCVVADATEIEATMPTVLRRFGETFVLWRDPTGAVRAELDGCPHRDQPLEHGADGEACLECLERATAGTEVREAHGWIWAWRGTDPPRVPVPDYFVGLRRTRSSTSSSMMRSAELMGWPEDAQPNRRANLSLDASDPRRSRVTATVPVDDDHVQVYVRAHRPAEPARLSRVFDALGDLLMRRRSPTEESRAIAG